MSATAATNTIGVHALVWVAGWSEPEARCAIERTVEAGYDLIEIPLLDPTAVDPLSTRRLLEEHALSGACSLGLPFDADVSSADPSIAARGETLLMTAVEVTAELGAGFLGGVVHSAMGKHLERPTDRGRRHAVEALRRVAEHAARRGVTIGIEAVNRYESNLVNTAEQALALVDEIGAENVVVHLDSYHMNIEERDLTRPVHDCRERLGYLHVGESHRGCLGRGGIDFPSLFRALVDIGYRGPIVFESFSSVVASPAFVSALAIWRDPWQDSRDVAYSARVFVEHELAAARGGNHPIREAR